MMVALTAWNVLSHISISFLLLPKLISNVFLLFLFEIIMTFFWVTGTVSHWRSAKTDPGIVPVGYKPEFEPNRFDNEDLAKVASLYHPTYCDKCDRWRPPRAHHSRDARACVMKYDHYCPFVGNVVGAKNEKYFLLFTFYAMVHQVVGFFLSIFYLMITAESKAKDDSNYMVLVAFSLWMFFIFGFSSGSMFFNQMSLIIRNMSGVDRVILKKALRLIRNGELSIKALLEAEPNIVRVGNDEFRRNLKYYFGEGGFFSHIIPKKRQHRVLPHYLIHNEPFYEMV
ncbi:hypothetical protein PCE1_002936 [Barthelona sp. PCE]